MYPQISPAAMTLAVRAPEALPVLEPLDPESFEDLSTAAATSLLSSRFHAYSERGWDWQQALLLAVRPDHRPFRPVPLTRSGDASAA